MFADGCEISNTASASFFAKVCWPEIVMARATAAIGAPRVCACCRSGSSPFAGLSGFAELGSAPDGADCCASAARDHVSVLAASVAPKHVMNCRRFMSVAPPPKDSTLTHRARRSRRIIKTSKPVGVIGVPLSELRAGPTATANCEEGSEPAKIRLRPAGVSKNSARRYIIRNSMLCSMFALPPKADVDLGAYPRCLARRPAVTRRLRRRHAQPLEIGDMR